MLKKLNNWFKNLTKLKCPKCKSVELEKLDEKFLYITSKPYYSYSKFDLMRDRPMIDKYSYYDRYVDYKVYNIKYQCKKCQHIFNKVIEK